MMAISFRSKYLDENWACRLAIDQARNSGSGPVADDIDKHHWLHQWSYSTCKKHIINNSI